MDVEELLRDTAAPTMDISPSVVVAAAKGRARRRHRILGLTTGAVAAAAAVAIAVGTAGSQRVTPRPVPADSAITVTDPAGFIKRADVFELLPTAGVGSSDGLSPTTPPIDLTNYAQVYERAGALSLRTFDADGRSRTLVATKRFTDGAAAVTVRGLTVVAVPISSTPRFSAVLASGDQQELMAAGNQRLPSGRNVVVMLADGHTDPADLHSILWVDARGQVESNSGATPAQVILQPAEKDAPTFFKTRGGVSCGISISPTGRDNPAGITGVEPADGRECQTLVDLTHPSSDISPWAYGVLWALTVPGPVSSVNATFAAGVPAGSVLTTTALPGSQDVVLWIRAPVDLGKVPVPVRSVTWRGPDGTMRSWAG